MWWWVSEHFVDLNETAETDYVDAARPVVEKQLALAGARLAAILNSVHLLERDSPLAMLVNANQRTVGGNHFRIQVVDFAELFRLGCSRAGHATTLGIEGD